MKSQLNFIVITTAIFSIILAISIAQTDSQLDSLVKDNGILHQYDCTFQSCELPFDSEASNCGSRTINLYATNKIIAEMHIRNNYYCADFIEIKEVK